MPAGKGSVPEPRALLQAALDGRLATEVSASRDDERDFPGNGRAREMAFRVVVHLVDAGDLGETARALRIIVEAARSLADAGRLPGRTARLTVVLEGGGGRRSVTFSLDDGVRAMGEPAASPRAT